MKKLGRGWQYTTYDIGNGRVLKKYNSKLVGYTHMFKVCFPFKNDQIWKLPSFYKGCRETAIDSIKKISEGKLDSWMTGNPKILNELDYEQDKLKPLHICMAQVDLEGGKKIIDEFVEFNKILVKRSLIDKSFNIALNFGLDSKRRVVLMDLGELFYSDEAIQKQIKNRVWTKHYNVDPIPENLREYFVSSMDQAFVK